MNDTISLIDFYQQRITAFSEQLNILLKKRAGIAWLRFAIVLATFLLTYAIWHNAAWAIISFVSGILLFLYVVKIDINTKDKIQNLERLSEINKDEINILEGNYLDRESGSDKALPNHAYAEDLDIFGTASLYQYINRCNAEQGKQLLADQLLNPQAKANILLQQTAVKELKNKTDWRQQFQSFGIANPVTKKTEQKIVQWLQTEQTSFKSVYWKWLLYIYPVITIGAILLYLNDTVSASIFYLLVFAFFVFAFSFSKKINITYALLSKIVPEITTLYNQLNLLEKEDFINEKFITLKSVLRNKNTIGSSTEILKLKNILNRFDVRLNIFAFFIVNTFLLWDLWQMLALSAWKKKNAALVPQWFQAIAEMEVSLSLATLSFNQPAWCYPKIADEYFTFEGVNIGHPLIIKNKRVDNSFVMQGTGKIALITGSNMAGKSTFLRSVGVNIILAFMGSPVCAERFIVSPVHLMSSMRIADNLAESTSTFYAELKKLQSIIEAVNRKEKIFILLDEMLRGTNSLDRHTGSKALMKQLVKQHAVAVIATHDVELAQEENDFANAVTNYHFDVQVANDELFFDYKLKDGICKSLNASILMKKIGIEL